MKFIIWDPRDGSRPRLDDDGNIDSDGLIGRVGPDNVYLCCYAGYPKHAPSHRDLGVNQAIKGVVFRLSGSKGVYDVYRVE